MGSARFGQVRSGHPASYGDERRSAGRRHRRADRAPDAALRRAEADRRRPLLGQRARTHGGPAAARPVQRVRQHRADCELRRGAAGRLSLPPRRVTAAREHQSIHRAQLPRSPPYAGTEGIAKWRRCARWLSEFGALWHSSEKFDRVGWMLASIEYSWPEKLRFNRAAERSFGLLYADLLSVNLSETVPQVEVPVFFAEGRHDRMAPAEVAERYFTSLIASRKELVWFENSAHFPQWEERARFHEFLLKTVLPATAV